MVKTMEDSETTKDISIEVDPHLKQEKDTMEVVDHSIKIEKKTTKVETETEVRVDKERKVPVEEEKEPLVEEEKEVPVDMEKKEEVQVRTETEVTAGLAEMVEKKESIEEIEENTSICVIKKILKRQMKYL